MDDIKLARELLSSSPSQEQSESLLLSLGGLVTLTARDESARNSIIHTENFWTQVVLCLEELFEDYGEYSMYYYRTLRGVLLLVRNLALLVEFLATTGGADTIRLAVIDSLGRLEVLEILGNVPIIDAYLQTIANIVQAQVRGEATSSRPSKSINTQQNDSTIEEAANADKNARFKLTMQKIVKELERIVPLLLQTEEFSLTILLQGFILLNKETSTGEILSNDKLTTCLIEQLHSVDTDQTLSQQHQILLEILEDIIVHESFNRYLHSIYDQAKHEANKGHELITKVIQTGQLVVTAKEEWADQELVALLSWIFDFFNLFSTKAEQILPSKRHINLDELNFIHTNLMALLDCLSELGKYETTRQFLDNYGATDRLVLLLRSVHENIPRKTLKTRKIEDLEERANEKRFPQAKSLVIEVLSYLAHDNKKIQDRIREIHGLELVLSSCMIDENDPFVKERAITCIKILLDKNPENQAFVGNLEAQQTVDDGALREAGYEVDLSDGQVRLKKANE